MRCLILTLVLFIFVQPTSAALKRCVDDEGKSHYYNKILPSECEDKATTEMNKQGVVLNRTETKQTVQPEEDKAARLAEEESRIEKERRDAVLLNTYTSEEEIDLARERNVHPVELTIVGVEKRLEIVKTRLRNLLTQAKQAAQAQSPALAGIKQEIIPVQREAKTLQNELKENQLRIENIKTRFDTDKTRFIALMAQKKM